MYSFEGQFKRKPEQSLGGASRKLERNELLHQANAERQHREDRRRQNVAATCIQSFFRATSARSLERQSQRRAFDERIQRFDANDSELVGALITRLSFFYDIELDAQRLIRLTQACVQFSPNLIQWTLENPDYWLLKLQKLCNLNIDFLRHTASRQSTSIAIPLRILECLISQENYIGQSELLKKGFQETELVNDILRKLWSALFKNAYFSTLRLLLENRVPSSLIASSEPPTPLAALLLDFLFRPLRFHNDPLVFKAMLIEVFSEPFTPQIHSFLLPAFATKSREIDADVLLKSLLMTNEDTLTPWMLYTCIRVMSHRVESLAQSQVVQYLEVLSHVFNLFPSSIKHLSNGNVDSDEDDGESISQVPSFADHFDIIKETIELVNQPEHISILIRVLQTEGLFQTGIVPLCRFAYFLFDQHRLSIFNFRFLYTLAFKPSFLRELWSSILHSATTSVFGESTPLLQHIRQGLTFSLSEQEKFIPQLTLFCALLNHFLSTLHDFEFYADEKPKSTTDPMPFSLTEMATICLILRDVCMGLINLAYPETRPTFNADYSKAMHSVGARVVDNRNNNFRNVHLWNQLLKHVILLLRHLYSRDSRRKFCPEGQWIAKHFSISFQRAAELSNRELCGYEPFVGLHPLTKDELLEGPPPTALEVRQIAVLQEFPFVIHFHERVKIFQSLIAKDKSKNQGDYVNFQMGPQIHAMIRRNFIYEDAFDNLSVRNAPNLKMKVTIQLVNAVGLDEVGIDGGGIFREFLNELLKTCFDPNRGFFKTTHDCLLYPNPNIHRLIPDFTKHYYFIGRMLGKAIYENMLVELPFAEFFLAKLLAQHSSDVDIHHLASLDPVMYKNLLYLKTFDGDISDLGLDFTVMSSEFGENEVIELKPGGANITVDENNRINYIHLMADYKLNKQLKAQCQAFKEGLANVIDLQWLYMFDPNELQVLVSGAQVPIDITDLKAHTNYAGGYREDHPVIQAFWNVVENFDEGRRRQLLKFVTSCSRPPLLGFKELTPGFCIQNAGREPNRLPTASTCMNLLKLPEFQDEDTLKTKLLYAVESGAGFELS